MKRRPYATRSICAALLCLSLLLSAASPAPAGASAPPAGEPAPEGAAPPSDEADVIVFGATPEGVVAAVRAAREGARVILADTRERPGGVITHAWLNMLDLNYAPDGSILHGGIFREWFRRLEGEAFDLRTAERAFRDLLAAEPGIRYLPGVRAWRAVVEGGRVQALEVVDARGTERRLVAPVFVDASEDADLAAAAGAPWRYGMEEVLGRRVTMASTLVFRLGGVDWDAVRRALNGDRDPHTGATRRSAWGFLEAMRGYRPADPLLRVRGLNLGRQNDGSVLVNALLIFGVDPLDPASRRQGRERALAELPRLVAYMRGRVPGFRDAVLLGAAPELYVRESRHVLTLYRLTIDDVLENRDFLDAVAYGSYPVDIQATDPEFAGAVLGRPQRYGIPLRSLVPLGLTNVFVVGRSAGYDPLAAGSARTVPVGMATAEAAGAAAALAAREGIGAAALALDPVRVAALRVRLRAGGVRLDLPRPWVEPYRHHWAYPAVRFLRRYALAVGGYRNDYRLDEPMTLGELQQLLRGHARRFGGAAPVLSPSENPHRVPNVAEGASWIARSLAAEQADDRAVPAVVEATASVLRVIAASGGPRVTPEAPLTRGVAYALVYALTRRAPAQAVPAGN